MIALHVTLKLLEKMDKDQLFKEKQKVIDIFFYSLTFLYIVFVHVVVWAITKEVMSMLNFILLNGAITVFMGLRARWKENKVFNDIYKTDE